MDEVPEVDLIFILRLWLLAACAWLLVVSALLSFPVRPVDSTAALCWGMCEIVC